MTTLLSGRHVVAILSQRPLFGLIRDLGLPVTSSGEGNGHALRQAGTLQLAFSTRHTCPEKLPKKYDWAWAIFICLGKDGKESN